MAKFSTGNLATGRARQLEIAAENQIEIETQTAHLIHALMREPTPGELIEAELVAVAFVKSRRLRANGRDDSNERRLLRDLMASSIFGSVPEPSPAERQHGPAVAAAYEKHDRDRAVAAMENVK